MEIVLKGGDPPTSPEGLLWVIPRDHLGKIQPSSRIFLLFLSASTWVPACVPVCEAQKVQVIQSPESVRYSWAWILVPPLTSCWPGHTLPSLNLGLLICGVRGRGAGSSLKYLSIWSLCVCGYFLFFIQQPAPTGSLFTWKFGCWRKTWASLGWNMSGFSGWEKTQRHLSHQKMLRFRATTGSTSTLVRIRKKVSPLGGLGCKGGGSVA